MDVFSVKSDPRLYNEKPTIIGSSVSEFAVSDNATTVQV
jgi:hypothetical protein